MKAFVHYVEDCANKYKEFKTLNECKDWTLQFVLENQDKPENFIFLYGEGRMHYVDPSIKENE